MQGLQDVGYLPGLHPAPPLLFMSAHHKWYGHAAWHKGYRLACLQREPLCEWEEAPGIRCNKPGQVVDHVKTFVGANPDGTDSWEMFSDPKNHQTLCTYHHNRKTVLFDRGFGRAPLQPCTPVLAPTGGPGKQFHAHGISDEEFNRVMAADGPPKK
jgi:hypothetical protein